MCWPTSSSPRSTAGGCTRRTPWRRLHKEVKRRTQVVGIFPDRASLIRLAGMLLAEQDDEWAVTDRRYFTFESMARINDPEGGEPRELLAAIA